MKHIATLFLLAALTTTARAESGFNLNWDHCYADGDIRQKLFACDRNTGSDLLVVSVTIPADLPRFAAASGELDILFCDETIPPWWQTAAGECRAQALRPLFAIFNFPASDHCLIPWGIVEPYGVWVVQPHPRGYAGALRLMFGAAVPAGWESSLVADGSTEYEMFTLALSYEKSTGVGACAGCRSGAALVLVEMSLQQPAGIGDWHMINTRDRNWVTFNSDGSPCGDCGGYGFTCRTPTLNRTWGAIKGMYR